MQEQNSIQFTPLPAAQLITEHNWDPATIPLVSIGCITYNHVNFIRDAIEGFLMQETTFPVEIIIHDDASTDGTADIVRDYESRYPQIIKAIYQDENQFSKGNKATNFILPLLRGKYIAFCEGDDYWTDPRKLQIQACYLEDHPACVISGHDAFIENGQGDLIASSQLPEHHKRDYSARELLHGDAWILTMSWMYRNVLPVEPIPERKHILNGDTFTTSLLGQFGGSHFHSDIKPACYRRHKDGVWSSLSSKAAQCSFLTSYYWISSYWERSGCPEAAAAWHERWSVDALKLVSSRSLVYEIRRRTVSSMWSRICDLISKLLN